MLTSIYDLPNYVFESTTGIRSNTYLVKPHRATSQPILFSRKRYFTGQNIVGNTELGERFMNEL
jgi:hypothetical protein